MPGMSKQQQAQVMAATAVSEPKRVPGEKVCYFRHLYCVWSSKGLVVPRVFCSEFGVVLLMHLQVSLPMHSSDMIFSEIRDLSIEALGPFLQVHRCVSCRII